MLRAMDPLFLDIETTFTLDQLVCENIAASIKPPATHKKPETIAKWEAEQKPAAVRKALHDTALDGGLGSIVAIGLGVGPARNVLIRDPEDDEGDLLDTLFGIEVEHGAYPVIVGHNVLAFDLPFLMKRAVVLGKRIPTWFPKDLKPWSDRVFDTMQRWGFGSRDYVGLNRLAGYLGLSVNPTIDGAEVPGAFHDGRLSDIVAHCDEDLRLTQLIWGRMRSAGL
jgi:hypothetical protein